MANKERDFKWIWIPKEIWLSTDLTVMEKLFIVEINSLDNEDGCFASNSHFSEMFGITKWRCTQILKSLEAKKHISIELEREWKNITKRVVRILSTLFNKLNTPIAKTKYPYLENAQESNTSINNTSNIISKDTASQVSVEKIEYWNKEINDTLAFLKKACWITDFKEPSGKQRMFCKHIINLTQKISKEEMIERLKGILEDDFKAKNCNGIVYLYRELKSYIHSPVIPKKEVKEIKITY
jgi:hypothetical protein